MPARPGRNRAALIAPRGPSFRGGRGARASRAWHFAPRGPAAVRRICRTIGSRRQSPSVMDVSADVLVIDLAAGVHRGGLEWREGSRGDVLCRLRRSPAPRDGDGDRLVHQNPSQGELRQCRAIGHETMQRHDRHAERAERGGVVGGSPRSAWPRLRTRAWTRDVRCVRSRPRGSSPSFERRAHQLLRFWRAPDRHQVLAEVPALVVGQVERPAHATTRFVAA